MSWLVRNPDSSGATSNRLDIIELSPIVVTNSYTWSDANQNWDLVTGNGLRDEAKVTTTDSGTGDQIVTDTIRNGLGDIVHVEQSRFHTYTGALGSALISQSLDPTGINRTTTYTYYTNTTDTNYGKLEMVVPPTGPWTHYVYGTNGLLMKEINGFSNTPPSLTADESLCRVASYDYTPLSSSDDGTIDPQTPRTTIVSILGHAISTNYAIIMPGTVTNIQVQGGGLSNLVTATQEYTNGNPWVFGRTKLANYPDATREVDFYAFSDEDGFGDFYVTNTVLRGAADPSNGTNITSGTRTTIVMQDSGRIVSTTTFDFASTLKTSQAVNQLDGIGRTLRTDYLDGTHTGYSYACCGLDATTNRDGGLVTYDYDALRRQTAQHTYVTAADTISTSTDYDPTGNATSTTRIGTNGSSMTQSASTYDLAGQLTSTTDALGNVTHYTNYIDGSGQMIKTTTYPDLSTRVETYFEDGSLAKVTGTAVHGIRYVYGVEQDGGIYRSYTKEIKLNSNGTDTAEWTKTYIDAVGRAYKTVFADSAYAQSFYNNQGQLTNQIDPDGVSTLYAYNAKGEQSITALDMNTNGAIDFAGTDRITMVTNDVTSDNGTNVNRSRTYVWETSADSPTLAATSETSVEGLQSWSITWNNGVGITNHSVTAYNGSGGRFVTNTAPDGSYSSSIYQFGRLASITNKDSLGNQLSAVTCGYDVQGRQNTTTDARNGTMTSYYNNADQVTNSVTPSPDHVLPGQSTTLYVDNMGRITRTTLPDNTSTTNQYYSTGELQQTSGSRTYPVGYSYDAQGRMTRMTNWSDFGSGAGSRVTTWNYDAYRGFLTNKTYDGGSQGPTYTYTLAGRLQTRTWARGIVTSYGYNNAGNLCRVSYSDGTAGITNGFDRLGRNTAVTNGASVCLLTYNDAGSLLGESYSGGPLNGLTVTNSYDSVLRRRTNGLWNGSGWLTRTYYGYDNASRLLNVGDGTNSATYSYVANAPLVSQILFTNSGTLRMTTTKSYDYLNRLNSISSVPSASSTVSFSYANSTANQRTSVTNADNSYWVYQYDSLGQVTSGKKYWSDGTLLAGQQFTYTFDNIGNRTQTQSGGDSAGSNLRVANYTNNSLNQITSRGVPGYVDIQGSANTNALVTVNGQNAYRKGAYFREEIATNNSSGSVWLGISNIATLGSGTTAPYSRTNSGSAFLAQTPEQFGYDVDGNLTNDGRFAYAWDAENRLINMTSQSTAPTASKLKLDFVYDYQGRRMQKIVSTNSGSYVPEYTNNFAYDGWNLIVILNTQSSVLQSFKWGVDLSGSMQRAGGVGGLLEISEISNSQITNCFVAYDGNGNVAGLLNAADGTSVAQYEYGPFGEVIRSTGLAVAPFGFSTKVQDETGLLYYGYRYLNPITGRWLSRDPIQESGGMNLYGFVMNAIPNNIDGIGLDNPMLDWNGTPVGPVSGDADPSISISTSLLAPPAKSANDCNCGPDVTIAVDNTLMAIQAAFDSNPNLQRSSAESLYVQGNGAWDITYLQLRGFGTPQTRSSKCGRSVVYKGTCVYAGALNYIAWGKMNRIAHDKFAKQPLSLNLPGVAGAILGTFRTVADYSLNPLSPFIGGASKGQTIQIDWSEEDTMVAVGYRKFLQRHEMSEEASQAYYFAGLGYTGRGFVPLYTVNGGRLGTCSTKNSKPLADSVLHGHFGSIKF